MDILGLKPNEHAAIVFGIVGMIFGLISYRRSKHSEALANEGNERARRAEERTERNELQARELAFAQRKREALKTLNEGEAAILAARRKMLALSSAALESGATEVIQPAEDFATSYETSLAGLKGVRQMIESMNSSGRSHEDLLLLIESNMAKLEKLYDSKLLAEEIGSFTDEAERSIRLHSVHREVARQLNQPPAAATQSNLPTA